MTQKKLMTIPDISDSRAIRHYAAAALSRYDVRRPAFNLAANVGSVSPDNKAFLVYKNEAHDLITASLQALKEFDSENTITRSTRERFALEDTKDRLRRVEGDYTPAEYQALHDKTMGLVASKLTGMESLALSSAPFSYAAKKPAGNIP